MADTGGKAFDASFGAARSLPPRIEVQQVKEAVRARLFGVTSDTPRLGEYRILRRIGRGGMGSVYEAVGSRGEVVALKTLRGFSPAMLFHLKSEFRALAGVVHPNLVALDKLYVYGSQAYFTMELVEGVDLVRFVRGDAPPGEAAPAMFDRLGKVLPQLIDAVATLHRAGKLHRDLKPSNVLVTASGRVVVLDFGLARDISEVSSLTSSNESFVGTPAYMAPELAAGEPLDEAGDWYAVGVILFEALGGTLPFAGGGLQALLDKSRAPAPAITSVAAGIPEVLANLCDRLLLRDPRARPGLAELTGWSRVPSAPPPTSPVRVGRTSGTSGTIGTSGTSWTSGTSGTSATSGMNGMIGMSGMIGRERELSALRAAALATHEDSRPRVVCVVGPSGIGKSALLSGFVADAQRRLGARVLTGRCFTSESIPYRALDPLIDGLSRILVDLPPPALKALVPPESRELARLFPVFGRVAGFTPLSGEEVARDPLEVQQRAIVGLRRLLGALAAQAPLILVIDDLQWGDADSAALLSQLLRAAEIPSITVVAGLRGTATTALADNPILGSLVAARGVGVERIDLGPLAAADARALIATFAAPEGGPGDAVPPEDPRIERLVREAAGVPLLLVELARHLEVTEAAGDGLALEGLISRRLAGLPAAALRILEVLALAGRPLAQPVALRAASVIGSGWSLIPRLQAGNLVALRRQAAGVELEVAHERIRVQIVDGLPPERRLRIHRDLALALAAVAAPPERIVHHVEAAGLQRLALRYTVEAGDAAFSELAFRRAVSFYTRALTLAGTGLSNAERRQRRRLHQRLARALIELGRGVEAADHYFAAAGVAGPGLALSFRRDAALLLLRSGAIDRGTAALRGVLHEVEEPWPASGREGIAGLAAARMSLGLTLRLRGLSRRSQRWLRRRRPPTQAERARIETLAAAREGLSATDPAAAMAFQIRFLRRAIELGDPNYLVPALAGEAAFVAHVGDGARVERLLAEAHDLLGACDDPRAQEAWGLCAAVVAFSRGRWRECLGHLAESRAPELRHSGSRYVATMQGFFDLNARFYLGELGELRRSWRSAVDEADLTGDLCASTTLRGGLQIFALLTDDAWEEAQAELRWARERWPAERFVVQRAWSFLGERAVDLYAGERAEGWARAWERTEVLWPVYRKNVTFAGAYLRIMGRLWRANLALATARGGRDPRIDIATAELREIAGERVPWARPLVALLRGGVLTARGQRARAINAYAEASSGFTGVEMPLWAAAAELRRGELLGAERGSVVIAAAEAVARAEGVVDPMRLLGTLAPRPR